MWPQCVIKRGGHTSILAVGTTRLFVLTQQWRQRGRARTTTCSGNYGFSIGLLSLVMLTYVPSHRHRIIMACGQRNVESFEHCFPPHAFPRFTQFDTGSYSKVLRCKTSNQDVLVIKMIKLKLRRHQSKFDLFFSFCLYSSLFND